GHEGTLATRTAGGPPHGHAALAELVVQVIRPGPLRLRDQGAAGRAGVQDLTGSAFARWSGRHFPDHPLAALRAEAALVAGEVVATAGAEPASDPSLATVGDSR